MRPHLAWPALQRTPPAGHGRDDHRVDDRCPEYPVRGRLYSECPGVVEES